MKTFIIIFFMLAAGMIVVIKLVTFTEPVTSPEIATSDLNQYEKDIYQDSSDRPDQQGIVDVITDQKLMAFARAFVHVQSYMNHVGNRASYEESGKIVQNHGLSIDDYTRIATLMNANSDFQSKVMKMINEVKLK